jgi:hypothetical protein
MKLSDALVMVIAILIVGLLAAGVLLIHQAVYAWNHDLPVFSRGSVLGALIGLGIGVVVVLLAQLRC